MINISPKDKDNKKKLVIRAPHLKDQKSMQNSKS